MIKVNQSELIAEIKFDTRIEMAKKTVEYNIALTKKEGDREGRRKGKGGRGAEGRGGKGQGLVKEGAVACVGNEIFKL